MGLSNDGWAPPRHGAEHFVPGGMTVLIVDPLEVVGVNHHHRKRPLVAERAAELALERGEELTAVQELRRVIYPCENPPLRLQLHKVRHMLIRPHSPPLRNDLTL